VTYFINDVHQFKFLVVA
jgi:hypothetical protein